MTWTEFGVRASRPEPSSSVSSVLTTREAASERAEPPVWVGLVFRKGEEEVLGVRNGVVGDMEIGLKLIEGVKMLWH